MSDEGETDILQRNIADVRTSLRQHGLRLKELDNERLVLTKTIVNEMHTLEIFEESLHVHGQEMVNRYSTVMPKTASTFSTVEILESLHSRISALESRQA